MILTKGEYVVKVIHETFLNHRAAAAAVEFETSKGRVFGYHPGKTATKWSTEQTVLTAEPGHEIIGLHIRHGVLIGSEQQPAPAPPRPASAGWWAICALFPKEDTAAKGEALSVSPASSGGRFTQFEDEAAARVEWAATIAAAGKKQGRGAIFIDCKRLEHLDSVGCKEATATLLKEAIEAGLHAGKKEQDISIVDATITLFKLLGGRKDLFNFLLVTALIAAASFFDLEGKVMIGLVLTTATAGNATAAMEAVNANRYSRALCASQLFDCEAAAADPRMVLIAAFLFVRFAERIFDVANIWVHHYACDSRNKTMKLKAFNHVLGLDQGFFDTHTTSEIKASMNVHAINNLISWNIPYLFSLTVKLAMVAYFMISIDCFLGVATTVSAVVVKYGVLDPLERYEKNIHRVSRKLEIHNEQVLDEALDMMQSVKLFSKESKHAADYARLQDRMMATLAATVNLRCVREFLYGMSKVATFGGVLYFGLKRTTSGGGENIAAAELTTFFLVFQEFQDLFGRIKWHWALLQREFTDIERFLELMKVKTALPPGPKKLDTIEGAIEFNNVRFEYPSRPGEEALKGLDLKIRPKKMTAIVGGSGAGKSTVTKLLMRLYDPTSGTITVDGHDIRDIDTCSLHNHIGVVSQNPELFQGSLSDNIRYGSNVEEVTEADEDVVDGEVIEAARLANCLPFIEKFRAGFDTFAGSKGGQLSGGQKQRIAIARAAIRRSSVMILDEATSALDAENERLVQDALENIMEGKTTIVIAHRLSTIQNADEVICMDGGVVAERGTHTVLMAADGVYANLVRKQLMKEE